MGLHGVHALSQVSDATTLGLAALDNVLADHVAFPVLRRVGVIMARAAEHKIHQNEAVPALKKSMPRVAEILEVECGEYV